MVKELLNKYGRILKYIISGSTAAVVNIGTFSLLVFFTEVWYLAASVLAFLVAFGVSFSLQKFWTFKDGQTTNIKSQAATYLAVSLLNLALTVCGMYVLVDWLYPQVLTQLITADHWKVLAQIIVNGLIAFGSFFIYRRIFKIIT